MARLLGGVAVIGTLSAFPIAASNANPAFAAGTVVLTDNNAGSVFYNVSNQKPGVSTVRCIELIYTGSLDAAVKLYTPSSVNPSAQYINLTIEKGTSDTALFPNCGIFTPESTLFTGTLAGFASASNSYPNGIVAFPGAQTAWAQDDILVYRFTLSVQDDNAAQGASLGPHTFTWEARNH